MSRTHSVGLSRRVNCAVTAATFIFSLLAFCLLGAIAWGRPVQAAIAAMAYAACLVACSLCSYIYTTRANIHDRRLWRHLDHASIFLLIAGTYTPFALNIIGPFGIKLLWIIWILAVVGVVLRLVINRGYERLFVALYILIGWVFLTALSEVLRAIDDRSLLLLGLGAVAYTSGAGVFAKDIGRWTDPVWHGFVFVASYLHFLAVAYFTLMAL